jgi:outer membrane receptor protein involved in Fe transport
VKGTATQNLEFDQDVFSASLSGEPFDSWAGPVSVATGGEYRKEKVTGVADAISLVNGFFTGNYKPTIGSYSVREFFGETVVPLAKDKPGLKSLEFNGAVRATSYSLAGSVTTWKAGLTYKPIDAIMLRAVRSRDIRAPNLGELYQAGATQRQDIIDRTLPTAPSVSITRVTSGNTDLKPEIADTTSFGIVLRPTFAPGFNVSLDYYSITINGAVTSPVSQEIVDRCARGETALCALIVRNSAGVMTQILGVPVNVAQQKVRGYDLESTWTHETAGLGSFQVRALGTKLLDFYVFNNNVKTDSLGQNTGSTPNWRWLASVSWRRDPMSLTLTGRGFAAGVYDNTYVSGVSINDNHIPGATYWDLAGDYTFHQGTAGSKLVGYFKVENLLDLDPAIVAAASLSSQQTNPLLYDTIGRNFRLGVRFRY